MSEHTYKNPPITEAIIDIRCSYSHAVSQKDFLAFHSKVSAKYPKKRERRIWNGTFELEAKTGKTSSAHSSEPNGYLFLNESETRLVQVSHNGFTFNMLKPYSKWEDFRGEAKRIWDLYSAAFKIAQIEKIGLRYINRIEIPLPVEDIGDYFTLRPEIPKSLPQDVEDFATRLSLKEPDCGATANLVLGIDRLQSKASKLLPFLFDINIELQKETFVADKKMWDDFESLRNFKNLIFKKCITKKTERLFDAD